MRVLLDQNLSPKLIPKLADILPGLESVYQHGLIGSSDAVLFRWAREMGFGAVISADLDFVHLVQRMGPPRKVIRIDRCDFPSDNVEELFRREALRIHDFLISNRPVLLLKL